MMLVGGTDRPCLGQLDAGSVQAGGGAHRVQDVAAETGVRTVCLSGGVWQNHRLTEAVADALADSGYRVLINQRIPANDGGISYGQAAVAAATLAER